MSDKYAALKHAAQIVAVGDWLYHDRQKLEHVGGGFLAIDGKESVFCLNSAVGGIKKGNDVVKYIAAANPATILELLAERDADKRRIDVLRQDKDKLIDTTKERINKLLSRAEVAEKRIGELEARMLTVKLPPEVQVSNFPFAAAGANAMRKEAVKALNEACAEAGISLKIEAE